jgi:hypothetical protein
MKQTAQILILDSAFSPISSLQELFQSTKLPDVIDYQQFENSRKLRHYGIDAEFAVWVQVMQLHSGCRRHWPLACFQGSPSCAFALKSFAAPNGA